MSAQTILIQTDYIALGQFIKLVGMIDTGGQAKSFLAEADIRVNEEKENRRGKKLYPEDRITINGSTFLVERG